MDKLQTTDNETNSSLVIQAVHNFILKMVNIEFLEFIHIYLNRNSVNVSVQLK